MTGLHLLFICLGIALPLLVAAAWYGCYKVEIYRAHYTLGDIIREDGLVLKQDVLDELRHKDIRLTPKEFERFISRLMRLGIIDESSLVIHRESTRVLEKCYGFSRPN